jgi:hypothetical protein
MKNPTPEVHEDLGPDAGEIEDVEESELQKRSFTAAQRRRLASEGKALPDGSYPVETVEDLHAAAHLASTGHGDVAGARALIARRARELSVANPLAAAKNYRDIGAAIGPGTAPITHQYQMVMPEAGAAIATAMTDSSCQPFGSSIQMHQGRATLQVLDQAEASRHQSNLPRASGGRGIAREDYHTAPIHPAGRRQ